MFVSGSPTRFRWSIAGFARAHRSTEWLSRNSSTVFGGGGNDFIPNSKNNKTSFVDAFVAKGYQYATTNASLEQLDDKKRALGLFAASNLPTWLDRHVYTDNLKTFGAWNETAKNFTGPVVDTPGLKEMTLKAVNILHKRAKADNSNFLLMSEAASIDKMMHVGDYQSTSSVCQGCSRMFCRFSDVIFHVRPSGALADLLELDDTVKATIAHLEEVRLATRPYSCAAEVATDQ